MIEGLGTRLVEKLDRELAVLSPDHVFGKKMQSRNETRGPGKRLRSVYIEENFFQGGL